MYFCHYKREAYGKSCHMILAASENGALQTVLLSMQMVGVVDKKGVSHDRA